MIGNRSFTDDYIRLRAYFIWKETGRDDEKANWYQALGECRALLWHQTNEKREREPDSYWSRVTSSYFRDGRDDPTLDDPDREGF